MEKIFKVRAVILYLIKHYFEKAMLLVSSILSDLCCFKMYMHSHFSSLITQVLPLYLFIYLSYPVVLWFDISPSGIGIIVVWRQSVKEITR